MSDTEYAQLLTQGYDPELERQLKRTRLNPKQSPKDDPLFRIAQGTVTGNRVRLGRVD